MIQLIYIQENYKGDLKMIEVWGTMDFVIEAETGSVVTKSYFFLLDI